MDEYAEGVDLLQLASEMVVDAIVQPEDLRAELVAPLRPLRRQGPRVAGQAQRDPAGVSAARARCWAADRPRGAVPARVDGHAGRAGGRPRGAGGRARVDARPVHLPGLAARRAARGRAAASVVLDGGEGDLEACTSARVAGRAGGGRGGSRRLVPRSWGGGSFWELAPGAGVGGAAGREDPLRRRDRGRSARRGGRRVHGRVPRRRVRFKATAGLHHPIRATATGSHARLPERARGGRVRVRRRPSEDELGRCWPRRTRAPSPPMPTGSGARPLASAEEIAEARDLFVAYGSCSFDEPVEDLTRWGCCGRRFDGVGVVLRAREIGSRELVELLPRADRAARPAAQLVPGRALASRRWRRQSRPTRAGRRGDERRCWASRSRSRTSSTSPDSSTRGLRHDRRAGA